MQEFPGLIRLHAIPSGLMTLSLLLALSCGCDYSAPESLAPSSASRSRDLSSLPRELSPGASASPRAREERAAILESSMTLIQRAALKPGGKNFDLAIQKLNHYFEGTSLQDYVLDRPARAYLETQLTSKMLADLENSNWLPRDTRHIEDCMMYYGIASRIAGTGEDLSRVQRVFDWVISQVQLVPAGSLHAGQLPQAFARPYDVLLRGMATEADGYWAERAWLFMALCRQLGIDTGLVTYAKSNTLVYQVPRYGSNSEIEAILMGLRRPPRSPIVWICAALIDDKAYLFDARVGLAVPSPGGSGVATLEEAMTDPEILEHMNLPGRLPYGTSRASLLASPTRIGILIDSSSGFFSPKMRLLQRELAGKNRTILYRDPAEQRDHFARALGNRLGEVKLWALPLDVETRLFGDSMFVASIQASLYLFQSEFPLVYARVKQLRGEYKEAITDYIKLRFQQDAPQVNNKKAIIKKDVQEGLDVYSGYYLALAHLESGNVDNAELMFRKTLELLPQYGPNQAYYTMFRWGANANLGRIYEAKKDYRRALECYAESDPTFQYVGNQIRARDLVMRNPLAKVAEESERQDASKTKNPSAVQSAPAASTPPVR
jgi:tetratricopeptide (TPR) repeat protein